MSNRAMAEREAWSEAQEMATYRPGQRVEIRSKPGIVDTVIAYDPLMVPPIVLASDPQPRYPEELILVTPSGVGMDWLKPFSRLMNGAAVAPQRQLVSRR